MKYFIYNSGKYGKRLRGKTIRYNSNRVSLEVAFPNTRKNTKVAKKFQENLIEMLLEYGFIIKKIDNRTRQFKKLKINWDSMLRR